MAYKIRANLFLNNKKRPAWMPKTINAVARAVRKATRLIPFDSWASPWPVASSRRVKYIGSEAMIERVCACVVCWELGKIASLANGAVI